MDTHQTHLLVETLAWTLIHFLWQGALLALLLWLLLAAMGQASSRVRYVVRCGALALMGLAPLVTFAWFWGEAPPLPVMEAQESLARLELATPSPAGVHSVPMIWIVSLWCLGAMVCVLRVTGGLWQVARLRRQATGKALAPHWQRRFDRLAREFGVRARAHIIQSATVYVPAVIGFAKPIVLLPARLFSGLSDEQIEALIAHELAHIARNDYLVNIVQSVVESLLFYHPAVWWVSRGIRVEREYCCDDLAVAATQNGLAYAHALTAIESWRGAQPQLGVSTLGGSLMHRIQRLVGVKSASTHRTFRPAQALAGLFMATTLSASAFAVATLPEPAACDCKCACHKKTSPHKAVHVVEGDGLVIKGRVLDMQGTDLGVIQWLQTDAILPGRVNVVAPKVTDQLAAPDAGQWQEIKTTLGSNREEAVRLHLDVPESDSQPTLRRYEAVLDLYETLPEAAVRNDFLILRNNVQLLPIDTKAEPCEALIEGGHEPGDEPADEPGAGYILRLETSAEAEQPRYRVRQGVGQKPDEAILYDTRSPGEYTLRVGSEVVRAKPGANVEFRVDGAQSTDPRYVRVRAERPVWEHKTLRRNVALPIREQQWLATALGDVVEDPKKKEASLKDEVESLRLRLEKLERALAERTEMARRMEIQLKARDREVQLKARDR